MWAACSDKPGTIVTSGLLARRTGMSPGECACFLAEVAKTQMVNIKQPSTQRHSVLYTVAEYLCVFVKPKNKPAVYM